MSYSDPKLVNDRTIEIVGGMTEMAKQQFAAERQQEQQRITQNISSLVSGGINALTPKAQAMNKLDKAVLKSSQNMYNKIGSTDFDTGLDKWDETLDGFMNGVVDRNNLTVQAMNNGSMIDLSKGQRDIAMYENIVNIYQEAVPNIRAASNIINRSAKATDPSQKLSLAGPPAYQLDIIRKMNTDEAGDLEIIQEGNNIIIRDPNATYIDPETGKEVKGTELNISQFNKAITDKENPYFKYATDTKPDTERNFNQKIKSGKDGAFNPLYVTINDKAKDATGQEVTTYNMTIAQQDKFKKDVIGDKGNGYANGGQFAGLIEKFGESIWEDQMQGGDENTQYPDEVPQMPTGSREAIVKSGDKEALKLYDEQAEEYGTYYNDYYKPMLDALANQSLNNAANNGIVLDKPKEEPKEETEEVTETEEVSEETIVEDEVVENKKGVNKALKIDVADGDDYIRKMFNYENTSGSSSGGGVGNYGFTGSGNKGAALKKLYDEAEGTPGEKGIKVVNEYIVGTSPDQEAGDYGTTILTDLGMDRETYDKLPENIKEQLVDWKFNTGRGSADLIAIASGIEIDGEKWDGTKAFENNSPTTDQIKDIDYSKLTPTALYDARQELYKKRIEGMERMLEEDPDNKKLKSDLKFAKDGYNNSQINRLKVEEVAEEEESAEDLVNNLTK